MASGQAITLTRMLHTTMASDSTKASISTQVTGLPHRLKAGASSGCSACSRRSIDGERVGASGPA
jgi:hypothetical protein